MYPMKFQLAIFIFLFTSISIWGQSSYSISFENAIHHEALIKANFRNIDSDTIEVRMSRTSPGRYALHEFMKNVYNVQFSDGNGKQLKASRPDPYSWLVTGHNGTLQLSYTLFANRGDGTYSQVDETHAHLNMPATFMYVSELADKGFKVNFDLRHDLNWKVATQLKHEGENEYSAENLHYFMDSPTEISDYREKSFEVDGQVIRFVLHDNKASDEDFNTYFDQVKSVVLEEKAVFGELPKFDHGEYRFLACYIPNASGDGMEHRNSTILTNTRSLANGGIKGNIGTVAHEFFHCWNVERIRPKALEPFDFEEADMSGELWFAEGFTSFYDDLSLVRSGVISKEDYIKGLVGTFNYVWNSPGREYFNPIEMSYQAPFVDAARSVDEVNRENTFSSYYSYGSMLALALDLSLRLQDQNLDDYMKLVWDKYGKTQTYYTVDDLNQTLNEYAGNQFGNEFFQNYIYNSSMPEYKKLLNSVGVLLKQDKSQVSLGVNLAEGKVMSYPLIGSAAHDAGIDKGDKIVSIDNKGFTATTDLKAFFNTYEVGDEVTIKVDRYEKEMNLTLKLKPNNAYHLELIPTSELTEKQKNSQENWLKSKSY